MQTFRRFLRFAPLGDSMCGEWYECSTSGNTIIMIPFLLAECEVSARTGHDAQPGILILLIVRASIYFTPADIIYSIRYCSLDSASMKKGAI